MTVRDPIPQRGSVLTRSFAVIVVAMLFAACTTTGGGGAATSPTPTTADGAAYPAGCPTAQPAPLGKDEKRVVTIKTDKGDIAMEIDGALSPIAAGNFVALCGTAATTTASRSTGSYPGS